MLAEARHDNGSVDTRHPRSSFQGLGLGLGLGLGASLGPPSVERPRKSCLFSLFIQRGAVPFSQ